MFKMVKGMSMQEVRDQFGDRIVGEAFYDDEEGGSYYLDLEFEEDEVEVSIEFTEDGQFVEYSWDVPAKWDDE